MRAVVGLMLHRGEEIDKRRYQRINGALHFRDDRADMRLLLALGGLHADAGHVLPARMLVRQACDRTQQRNLVHALRHARK